MHLNQDRVWLENGSRLQHTTRNVIPGLYGLTMSHFYTSTNQHEVHTSPRTSAGGRISHHNPPPPFDFNSRVKLPPIIKNELLTGRECGTKGALKPSTYQTLSANVSSFPRLGIETQRPTKCTETVAKRVNHVEKGPIHFPNSYVVLPPIGETSSWHYSGLSSLQEISRNSTDQTRTKTSNRASRRKLSMQRKRTETDQEISQDGRESREINNLPAQRTTTQANLNMTRENEYETDISLPKGAVHPTQTGADAQINTQDDYISLTEEQVEMSEIDPVHVLERLELSEEVEDFLESKSSQRRGGKCVALDPSLKVAVDIIRDNLLRQTMEELCMIW